MLSYQHMYHAGGLADVHKHAGLSVILAQLAGKDKPLTYMETHAGRGVYNLASREAKKTQEAASGIEKLFSKIPPEHPYAKAIVTTRAQYSATFYPGSPLIAKTLLRPTDKIHLCELHPQEFNALEQSFGNYRNISVYQEDGYKKTLEIAVSNNTIIMVDPSYEIQNEYSQAADFIISLNKKLPNAAVLLWYPLLKQNLHEEMYGKLAKLPNYARHEVIFKNLGFNMEGSGLISVNLEFKPSNNFEAIKYIFE